MSRKADQSEFTQRRRLRRGGCPVHGIMLVTTGQTDPPMQGSFAPGDQFKVEIKCPRRDCPFTAWVEHDSAEYRALQGEGSSCCRKQKPRR